MCSNVNKIKAINLFIPFSCIIFFWFLRYLKYLGGQKMTWLSSCQEHVQKRSVEITRYGETNFLLKKKIFQQKKKIKCQDLETKSPLYLINLLLFLSLLLCPNSPYLQNFTIFSSVPPPCTKKWHFFISSRFTNFYKINFFSQLSIIFLFFMNLWFKKIVAGFWLNNIFLASLLHVQ